MGSLATWGAVAGGAKEYRSDIQQRQETEARAAEKTLDQSRQEALIRLRAKYQQQAQERGFEHERGMQEEQQEGRLDLKKYELGKVSMEKERERQFEAVQTDKKLETQKEIAGMKADASGSKKDRWTSKTLKGGSEITPGGGIREMPDRIAIVDEQSGRTYTQQGQKFIPQGIDVANTRTAPRGAIADLLQNRDMADEFVAAYGYLPAEFFSATTQ